MNFAVIAYLLKERTKAIVTAGLLGGAAALLGLIIGSYPFKGRMDFLLMQNSVPYRELYSLSKSGEYVSNVLIDAAQSELFINEALHNANITLPSERKERLERWRDIVSIKKNFRSNVLMVEVKADTNDEALRLANAVAYVLVERNSLFRTGSVDGVTVRMLSGPIVEENPSFGAILFVTVGGILAGMVIALAIIAIQNNTLRTVFAGYGTAPIPPTARA